MHKCIGRLRGRAAPSDNWLDRLEALYPEARIHWAPAFQEFGRTVPRWIIANHTGSHVYRTLGAAMWQRVMALPPDERAPEVVYGAELMMDGGHVLRTYPPEAMEYEQDAVLRDLQEMRLSLADVSADLLKQAERKQTADRLALELRVNPGLQDKVGELYDLDPEWRRTADEMMDIAKDAWAIYFQNRKSFSSAGRPREVTA